MQINEPAREFADFDAIVETIGAMQDEELRVISMTKIGQAIRCAGPLSSVRIMRKEYSILMYFTLTGLVFEEFGYGLIPRTIIRNTDLKEFNTSGHQLEFILRKGSGATYGFPEDRIKFDLDDLRNCSPFILNAEKMKKDYRIIPWEVRCKHVDLSMLSRTEVSVPEVPKRGRKKKSETIDETSDDFEAVG